MKKDEKEIRKSLEEQLQLQGKDLGFYRDLINDYMFYWSLKKKLIEDIKEKGLRYPSVNGNGICTEKPNESVLNLQKTTIAMLKILTDLKLKEPLRKSDAEQDYL